MLIPFDSQTDHIIFQLIDFFISETGKIRAQKPEYALIAEALLCHVEHTSYIFYKRVQQNTSLMIHKKRNVVFDKRLFQMIGIHIHITDDHTDIPKPVSVLPHHTAHLFRHCIRFFPWILRQMKLYLFLFFLICSRSVPEQMLLQKCQGFLLLKTPWHMVIQFHRLFHRDFILLCNLKQRGYHLLTQRKELIRVFIDIRIFPPIHGDCYDHFSAMSHQLPEKAVLNRCETGKSIQHNRTVF